MNDKSYYRKATYDLGAAKLSQLTADEGYEVAFAGRSNAGKSSVLNALTQQKSLARTSKTPGRTQLINVFSLDEERRLIDLPGYGYAKVPESVKLQWQKTLNAYLQERKCLRGIVLIMDIRHPLKDYDQMMIKWAHSCELPVLVLLNKSDKLKKNPANNTLFAVRDELAEYAPLVRVQLFSALKKTGAEKCEAVLDDWFALGYVEVDDAEDVVG
jgi:GTP-binding protein